MIEEIITYNVGGKIFKNKSEAEKYNDIYERIKKITLELGGKVDGYKNVKKHNIEVLKKCFTDMCNICIELFPHFKHSFNILIEKFNYNSSSICHRVILDSSFDYPILSEVFFRFECINFKTGIEYTMPYFVKNPDFFTKNK